MTEIHLRPAASVCLVHRPSRSVLLGRRRVGAWPGYWAFPGGNVDPGESRLDAAVRELAEETHIVLHDVATLELLGETRVTVATNNRTYDLVNYALFVPERFDGRTTDELEPRWFDFPQTLALEPMARGTRTVLDNVADWTGW